jgi:ABC-type arginine transport system ATPase subunit
MVRSSRVDKAMQLLAVNNLLKVAGKEVILHVQQGQQRKVAMLRTLRMVIAV